MKKAAYWTLIAGFCFFLILGYSNCSEFKPKTDPQSDSNLNSGLELDSTPQVLLVTSPIIENLQLQILAKDGWYGGATEFQHSGPVIANGKIFIAYMANDNADRSHNIYAMMYDYINGKWTKSLVAVAAASGNDGHNAPSIYVGPSGFVEVFYGSLSAYLLTKNPGPFYKVSTKPYSIESWETEQNVPIAMNCINGGYTTDGSLHLMGNLNHAKRTPDGVWTSTNLIKGTNGGALGLPGAIQDTLIHNGVIYFVWSPYNGNGAGRRLYLIKSTDNGKTWTNINGTASFSAATGLNTSTTILDPNWHSTFPYPVYDDKYVIHKENEGGNPTIGVLKDGTVVVLDSVLFRLWKWNGTTWVSTRVNSNENPFETSLHVAADGKIVIHITTFGPTYYEIVEYTSRDNGTSWQRQLLKAIGPEQKNTALEVGFGAPFQGQPERALLQWSGRFNQVQTLPPSEIMFLDRPISK